MAILIILNRRILKGMKVLNNTSRRPPNQSQEPSFISNAAQERSQRRHKNEIRTTHMAIAIVISFAVLNLPRIAISAKEVTNTNLIINCVENKRKFFPSLQYYQIDIIARTCMMVNSAINFVIYSAVSHPFQVSKFASFEIILDSKIYRFSIKYKAKLNSILFYVIRKHSAGYFAQQVFKRSAAVHGEYVAKPQKIPLKSPTLKMD